MTAGPPDELEGDETRSYLFSVNLVASSDTNLCNLVGKGKEMHFRQTDDTNFTELDHLEHLQVTLH